MHVVEKFKSCITIDRKSLIVKQELLIAIYTLHFMSREKRHKIQKNFYNIWEELRDYLLL